MIAHCDIDAFYASVEIRRRPELAGIPLIVGGLGPRAVVTTASYEARRFGVASAMPMSRARRLCPAATVIPPDMSHYRAVSAEVWRRVRSHFGVVQQAGIDEAYVDCSAVRRPLRALRAMVADVEAHTGMVISVGVGPNRLIAKTTSGAAKPRGFAVLSREQACEQFASAPVRTLQGIGPRTEERLAALGIATVGALQRHPVDALTDALGTGSGRRLHALAHFVDDSRVVVDRPVKSCSRETTFPHDVSDPDEVRAALGGLAARLAADLARKQLRGRTIGIKVRLADWSTRTRAITLPELTADADVIARVSAQLLEREQITEPVRLVGVRAAGFPDALTGPQRSAPDGAQLTLPL